ncbi:hypothetical protein G9A89_013283 [Geosiphon pyriformis]|nr:hypothetical protein G9A89_013283 [Geosiphon pyriformis]
MDGQELYRASKKLQKENEKLVKNEKIPDIEEKLSETLNCELEALSLNRSQYDRTLGENISEKQFLRDETETGIMEGRLVEVKEGKNELRNKLELVQDESFKLSDEGTEIEEISKGEKEISILKEELRVIQDRESELQMKISILQDKQYHTIETSVSEPVEKFIINRNDLKVYQNQENSFKQKLLDYEEATKLEITTLKEELSKRDEKIYQFTKELSAAQDKQEKLLKTVEKVERMYKKAIEESPIDDLTEQLIENQQLIAEYIKREEEYKNEIKNIKSKDISENNFNNETQNEQEKFTDLKRELTQVGQFEKKLEIRIEELERKYNQKPSYNKDLVFELKESLDLNFRQTQSLVLSLASTNTHISHLNERCLYLQQLFERKKLDCNDVNII